VNRGGFDVMITNPPWESVEPQAKQFFSEHSALVSKNKMTLKNFEKEQVQILKRPGVMDAWLAYHSRFNHLRAYFRNAPQFANQVPIINGKRQGKDVNLYKLFVEQCMHLIRQGGRCGIVIPSGIYTDLGAMRLREMLFNHARITGLFGFENRKEIFEGVHRMFKFVVLTFENGGSTLEFPASYMRHDVTELGTFPESAAVHVTVDLVRKLSPDSLSLMEFRSEAEVKTAEKLFRYPLLSEAVPGRWNFKIHREFNLTDDIALFQQKPGRKRLPLLTGKMFHQFTLTGESSGYWIDEDVGRKAVSDEKAAANGPVDYKRYRWVYRRIASNVNQRTLITTIAPKNVFTEVNSPTLDLSASNISLPEQLYLSAVANSFVLDWLLRLKVTTTLNFFYIYQLPVPRLIGTDAEFRPLVERAARLVGTTSHFEELQKEVFGSNASHHSHGITGEAERTRVRAEIDAAVARLYDLTEEEFAHILSTFPLVPQEVKKLTLNAFRASLPSPEDKVIQNLIQAGESDKVEFKEGAAYSTQRNQKSPDMIRNVLREIAAFLNSAGGNVFLGVTDTGQVVGIADDMRHADPKKKNRDGYELFLRNSIGGKLGAIQSSNCKVSFHNIGNVEVCRILVPAATAPVYLDGNLIVRDGTSSRQLNAQEAANYIAHHW
jgi:hypothetical protein